MMTGEWRSIGAGIADAVRSVVVPEPTDPMTSDDADYRWSYTSPYEDAAARSPEQLLRAVWEGAPVGLRVFLRFGWRFGLGLHLGPADESHVLGWRIDTSSDTAIVVSARSRILTATNTVTAESGTIRWQTDVHHLGILGRVVWRLAAVVHQQLVPRVLDRVVRSQGRSSPTHG